MTIEFDDNGKFFTDIITKTPVSVIIQVRAHRITGKIHVRQDQRLKDELDQPEKFIAVTDAVIYGKDDQVLYRTKFLAVQRDEIIWILPEDDLVQGSAQ